MVSVVFSVGGGSLRDLKIGTNAGSKMRRSTPEIHMGFRNVLRAEKCVVGGRGCGGGLSLSLSLSSSSSLLLVEQQHGGHGILCCAT
jgi:hypothetical protein